VTKKSKDMGMSELRPRAQQVEKKRTPSNYEIEKNLRASLQSTDEGLKQFLTSLRQARMHEAAQSYRAMQMVLVQQRLWADSHHRTELEPLFRSIAKTSDELHKIFSSFAEVMKPLKELDKLRMTPGGKSAPQASDTSEE